MTESVPELPLLLQPFNRSISGTDRFETTHDQ